MVQSWPHVGGIDGAGVVEAVGKNVTRFKPGDSVLVFFIGHGKGAAFQEYAIRSQNEIAKKPDNMSFEDAAALPVCFLTAAAAIHWALNIALPFLPGSKRDGLFVPKAVLVTGGSSTVGSNAVSALRLVLPPGCAILTTASLKHHAHLSWLGATKCFDRNSLTLVQDIKAATEDGAGVNAIVDPVNAVADNLDLLQTYDPAGEKKFAEVVTGQNIDTKVLEGKGIEHSAVVGYNLFSCPGGNNIFPALEKLLADGVCKNPVKTTIVGRGLESLGPAINDLKEKGASGEKLIVTL